MSASQEKNSTGSNNNARTVTQLNTNLVETDLIARKETLPEDSLTLPDDYSLAVQKRQMLDQDAILTEQVAHYLSRERRKKLDLEIEELYNRVATELVDNPKDVVFALEKLKKAQGIVIEDARQYEEALYWVAQVKKMLVTRYKLKRWTYSWGLFVLFYALIWLIALVYGFFIDISQYGLTDTAGWFSTLAGGVGGVATMLYNLSWQVSVKQVFDRQHIMKYLVQPIMGVILGAVMFFIISAGFLVINTDNMDNPSLVSFTVLMGFIAGLSQEVVYRLIESVVQRLSPKTDKNSVKTESQEDVETFEALQKPAA